MDEFLDKYSRIIIYIQFGLILIGFGVLAYKTIPGNDSVEIIKSENESSGKEVVVEIGGSIEKPGVYKLPPDSRVEDLFTVSGGLSANADRDWVLKNINRAKKLTDGQKLYIMSQDEVKYQLTADTANKNDGVKLDQLVLGESSDNLVSINTSNQEKLESLPGIGPVYAKNIIEHRPYSDIEELVKRAVLKESVYQKIKDLISL